MKIVIILLFLFGIMFSGCLSNPMEEVPVLKVNLTLIERQGEVLAENFSLTQGTVNILQKPHSVQASFPSISGRTMIRKEKGLVVGSWENVPYNGNGTYSFNIGFKEENYPVFNDTVTVSIYIINKKAERIGFFGNSLIWK